MKPDANKEPQKRNQWCPLCKMRRIKNCNACYWSQGCCRDEAPRKEKTR